MIRSRQAFVHLHCHSDYSLLDGCARIDRYMNRLGELGMPAMALTDHGNLFGAMEFYQQAKKAGIQPIIGCEIYLVHDHNMDERPKRERNRSDDIADLPADQAPRPEDFPRYQIHHKTILAQNFKGYQNLTQLVSDAHTQGMYYRPRVDMERLARYSEGLIALSGCVNGVASQYLIYDNYEKARDATAQFVDIFGKDRYFIEIQDHGIPVQRRIQTGLLRLADEFGLRVVCTNDVHYVNKEDAEPHDALLCIQTGKILSDTNRMKYPCKEFYLKSREEMEKTFREAPESIGNTLLVAEMASDLEIPFGENHYPVFTPPAVEIVPKITRDFDRILDIYVREKNKVNSQNGIEEPFALSAEQRREFHEHGRYLLHLAIEGLRERYGVDYHHPDQYQPSAGEPPDFAKTVCEKLDYELAIITGTGFVDYFLIVWDFINWARQQNIPVGPGRGSGAGCMVSYVLRITDIEPLRFGLLFERMLNLERVSPPDFDVDFCMRRRDEVVEYVRNKYGADNVANIITYGKFGAKMVVRDLARVQDVPYAEADRIAKMVPDDLNITLREALEKSHELSEEARKNPVAAQIVRQGEIIEGMVRNTGKHACGIIIADQPITSLVPVTIQEGALTTQYSKGPVEDLGLLKMDFLGLKTLTVIADTQENIRRTTNLKDFDVERVPLDDAKTYALLNKGQTTGVFQLESGGMQSLCRQIGLSSFEEIIALIALYRPGPMQFIPQFVQGKKNPDTIQVPHPLLKDIVEETYGILVYQEQVLEAARIIAGYTIGEADILRRAMGKKIREVMDAQKEIFVKGADRTHGIGRKTALDIFAILEKFAQYGFNKSHSAAYAMLSYRTAYLKANYPVQFMAAVLSSELGNSDKLRHFIDECSAMGIQVLGPDVNQSRENFTPVFDRNTVEGSIRFGLAAIKGVGDSAAMTILEERERNQPFADFHDFVQRLDGRSINKRVIECLIKSGGFDFSGVNRGVLFANMDAAISEAAARQRDRAVGQESFFGLLEEPGAGENAGGFPDDKSQYFSLSDMLKHEKELLGFYISGHPMNDFSGLVEGINSCLEDELMDLPDRTPFRLCGIISNITKKLTRRDNRPWAFFNYLTRSHSFQVNLYPDTYAQYSHLLEEEKPFLIEGTVMNRDDEARLVANEIRPLRETISGYITSLCWILHPNGESESFLHQLRKEIDTQFGETSVQLAFLVDGTHAVLAETANSLSWKVTPESFQKLRRHSAVAGILVESPPVVAKEPSWRTRARNGSQ